MTNLEKYKDEIVNFEENKDGFTSGFCSDFVIKHILMSFGCTCNNTCCERCAMLQMIWLQEEYKEPRIQPEVKRLKADDKVLVSMDGVHWQRSYFKEYDAISGKVVVFTDGATSWSNNDCATRKFSYAKLPEESEGK